MNNEETKQQWAKWEPKLNRHIEDLVWGLFSDSKSAFFEKKNLSLILIEEFSKDAEVQLLTFGYVSSLRKLWSSRFTNPEQQLKIKARPQFEVVKAIEFQQFPPAPPHATTNFHASNSPAPPIQAPTSGGPVITQRKNPFTESNAPSISPANTPSAGVQAQPPAASMQPTVHAVVVASSTLTPGEIPTTQSKSVIIPASKPTFHLPNCKVGTTYSAKIEGTDKSGRQVVVADLRFPDGLGLTFDQATQMVVGQPLLDGDFDIVLQWSFLDTPGKESGTCRLTSNPDPKSLWKVIEPAGDLPYHKSHLDQKLLKSNEFTIAAASRRGRSHEHSGSFRDDDFFISDDPATGWSVLIVADGAGSAMNSREGSRIAVATAGKQLVESLAGEFGIKISGHLAAWDDDATSQNTIGTEFHYFFHKMAGAAIQAIEQEAHAQSAQVKEYSTTLLVAAVKKDGANTFIATFWMGDGAIAAYGPRGTVKLMGSPDGGEFAGQTRFLDRNALTDQGFGKRVRVGRLPNVSSVILMTDGVSDPYFETDNGLADPTKWDLLWDEIEPQLKDTNPELRLVEWLHFFKQGNHDDRTIALLW